MEVRVIPPGPADRPRIDKVAAKMALMPTEKFAESRQKLLNLPEPKRQNFVFMDESHIFYPYFCVRMKEFQGDKASAEALLAPTNTAASGAGTAAAVTAPTMAAPATDAAEEEEEEAAERQQRLATAMEGAAQHRVDKFADVFSIACDIGVQVPAIEFDTMVMVAGWEAALGAAAAEKLRSSLRENRNAAFNFMQPTHVRHAVYRGLVAAYDRILNEAPRSRTARLAELQDVQEVMAMCGEKRAFYEAEKNRRAVAVLTADELRERLNWSTFTVMHTFTLDELELVDEASEAGRGGGGASRGPAQPPAASAASEVIIDDEEAAQPAAPQRAVAAVPRMFDPATGQEVLDAAVGRTGAGASDLGHATNAAADRERQEKRKREAMECLADEREQMSNWSKTMRE